MQEKVGNTMRYMLFAFIFILTQSSADVSMLPSDKERPRPEHPIVKPPEKPEKPYKRIHRHYYYTNIISECDKYIEIIEKRDQEIKALKEELNRLRSVEQSQLRKELKDEYKREMKKFENRQKHMESRSKAVISN